MTPWKVPPEYPNAGDDIIAELNGCKVGDYARFVVREGEGLGHIKRWQLVPKIIKERMEKDNE